MVSILIVYGTSEGQTAKIAGRIAAVARGRGYRVDLVDGASPPRALSVAGYDAAIVGSSVHAGRHAAAIRAFIAARLDELARLPSAFFSVSLTAASPRAADREQAEALARQFLRDVGWRPARVATFAGALPYTRFGWLKRRLMRLIVARAGGDTDTSRDYEYTDWAAVERFAEDLLADLGAAPAAGHAAAALDARR
jgi:menaquinone-dependent protoporphyrinogen oxidase